MKITSPRASLLASVAGVAFAIALTSARAQVVDNSYTNGDLILGFQVNGGTQTLMVNLGAATAYRDTTTNFLNIANIDSQLQTITGSTTWYDSTSLYFGVAGARSNAAINDSAINPGTTGNLDPNSTAYYSRSRSTVGSPGSAGSTAPNVTGGNISTGSGSIISLGSTFNSNGGNVNGIQVLPTTTLNSWEDNVPIGGNAFSSQFGNIQFQFQAGVYASDFGGVTNVEGAIDVYRTPRYVAGGSGYTANTPSYQGTFVLDQSGNISFIVVPEPTTGALVALGGLMISMIRRRRSA
jgi:hypothetical protein